MLSHTQPDFEPGPYGIITVSIRFHPHCNPCQFQRILRLRYSEKKNFLGHVQKCLQGFQFRINICIEPVRTASTRFNPQRKTASTLVTYSMAFIVSSGLIRVNAVRTRKIQISIRNRNQCKHFEHDQTFFLRRIVLPESIRNWHGLLCGSIRAEPGRYGFNSVRTWFEIRLCVTAFPDCGPHSILFWPVWTRVDLHLILD
jgi:hypothetical protein